MTNSRLIRAINAVRCLRVLRGRSPLSRSEIGRHLKMSRATVGNAIKPLLDNGLVMESEEQGARSSAGRPGILVQLNPRGAYFVGIDISTTAINAVLIDLTMGVVAKSIVPTKSEYRNTEKMLAHFVEIREAGALANGYFSKISSLTVKAKGSQFGLVYNPPCDELFAGGKGFSATVNGTAVRPNPGTDFSAGFVSISFSPRSPHAFLFDSLTKLLAGNGMFFRSGSGALSLAYVGAGRLLGHVEPHMHSWDCLGAIAIIEAAGGKVTGLTHRDA